jgi:hypothetical protein
MLAKMPLNNIKYVALSARFNDYNHINIVLRASNDLKCK